MYASRLDYHISDWRSPDTRLRHHYVETFTPTEQFSAGIVFLCEDLRDSHIIRERPGLWHRRKGLEPSSGGFGDRCSTIKLRLHMSPVPGLEPGSVRTQLRVHRPGGLCLPPRECRYRLTGIFVVAKSALFRFPPFRRKLHALPCSSSSRETGLAGALCQMRTRSPPKRVRTAVCSVTYRASCPYHTYPWVVSSFFIIQRLPSRPPAYRSAMPAIRAANLLSPFSG